ncbi:MAG: hypothetical protein ACRELF_17070 [Gemmataceae bacterium]
MNESEWLACDDPRLLLTFMRGKASDRKYRLFMLNCCYHLRHLLVDKPYRRTVEIAEQFVDGSIDYSELAVARELAEHIAWWGSNEGTFGPLWLAGWYRDAHEGALAISSDPDAAAVLALATTMDNAQAAAEELCVPWALGLGANPVVMASTLRDVFHAPYRGVVARAAWRMWQGGIVPKLAQAIYDERSFDRLPILADALEEAGCTDADILNHCRQPGEHVRGCWVVDLLLGKT